MKRKRKKKLTGLVLAAGLVLLLAGCGSQTGELRLGTGDAGGNYYAYGGAIAQYIQEDTGETVQVKSTAGSAGNLRLMNEGFLQLAIVQSDLLLEAYEGSGVFADYGVCSGFSAVAGLYTEACQIIVPADSDIQTVADLYGKTVSLGEEDSGVVQNAQQILQAYGLSADLVTPQYLSFSASAAAMSAGEVDAFFCTAGAPTRAVEELSREMAIRVLSLDGEALDKLLALYDGYSSCTIPAGTYDGQEEDVTTLGVKAVLIANNKLSEDRVKQLTDVLFSHSRQLQYVAGGDTALDLSLATEGIPGAFHPGAAAYYQENGVTVDVSQDTGETSPKTVTGEE